MYRGQSGMFSWLFHRVTGLGILLFLLVHIVDITLLNFGPKVYNEAVGVFSEGYVRVLTVFLIGALFYHAYNGVRIILVDFWPGGAKFQSGMFYTVLALTIVSTVAFGIFVIGPIFNFCPQGSCSAIPM